MTTILVLGLAALVGLSIGLIARKIANRRRWRRALIEKPRSLEPIDFYSCTPRRPVSESADPDRLETDAVSHETEFVVDLTRQPSEAADDGVEAEKESHRQSG